MSQRTSIEWTNATWNPIRAQTNAPMGRVRSGWHCVKVSPGCANCYAEAFNKRLGTRRPYKAAPTGGPGMGVPVFESYLDAKALQAPLQWKKPRMIFVCSMTDLFGDWVRREFVDQIFAAMALCPQHTFQILTKRAARMRAYFERSNRAHKVLVAAANMDPSRLNKASAFWDLNDWDSFPWPLPNVWLGVSIEDQPRADERVPELLRTPAAVRFISAGPLLGPVDLNAIPDPKGDAAWNASALHGVRESAFGATVSREESNKLDWVIVEGESGPNARPMHPDWARGLRDQCAAAGVPFFFKQWGEWAPGVVGNDQYMSHWMLPDGRMVELDKDTDDFWDEANAEIIGRVGKKRAGRLLDGAEHNGMPAVVVPA